MIFSFILFLIISGFSYTNRTVYGQEIFIDVSYVLERIDNKQILTVGLVDRQKELHEHVNYDIKAVQSNRIILDEKNVHFHTGQGSFEINSSCSNSVIDFTITFHNLGLPPIEFDMNRIFNFSVKPITDCVLSVGTNSPSYIKGEPVIISGTAKPLINFKSLAGFGEEGCFVVDEFGNVLDKVSEDQQVQISCDVANKSNAELPFAYLVKIQDQSDDTITSLSWITGSLTDGQSFRSSLSWLPDSAGNYLVTSYLLNNIEESKPLETPVKFPVKVSTDNAPFAYSVISSYSNTPVSIQIKDPYGNLVGIDQIVPDSSGGFSKDYSSDGTLWEREGEYKVIAIRDGMTDEAKFSIIFEVPEKSEPKEEPQQPNPREPNQSPILEYRVDSDSFYEGDKIQFDARASSDSDGYIEKFEWYFNDGKSSFLPNPIHSFETSGTYQIEVKITDNDGAVTKETFDIKILKPKICGPGTWLKNGECIELNPQNNGIAPWMIITAVGGISAVVAGSVIAIKINGKKPINDNQKKSKVSSEVHVEIRGGLED